VRPLRLTFDLPVDDVRRAQTFYRRLFEAKGKGPKIAVGRGVTLHVVDETGWRPRPADVDYARGRTPRLEWRVDDVREWIARAVAAGATVRCQLTPGPDGVLRDATDDATPIDYAHVIDPFGHLWALARERPPGVTD